MTTYPLTAVPFTSVTLADRFWQPRLETNRTVTIPTVFRSCETFGRLDNFRRAARRMEGPYVGKTPFDDTDVYKAIEGASRSLAAHPDPALAGLVDRTIELIAAAQEPDGYLYTNRTIDPSRVLPEAGPARWSSLVMSHELYDCGHLYEAAAAHYQATGKRSLLDVALRSAALLRREFGPAARHDACGHEIVERGLAQLYGITGDRGLLEQARFFLEQRGRHEGRPLYCYAGNDCYAQDHLPVKEQREAVGHAVRAVYLYAGMTDVAALLPEPAYAESLAAIWRDLAGAKTYLTGGLGARHQGEALGEPYELPNATAYAETCAAIGAVAWNQRMFLASGEARFIDVLEQTLYNGVLSCASLDGTEFFYVNPLAADGSFGFNQGSPGRRPWFDVSCCPTGLSRFLPSLPGYLYAVRGADIFVNLFAGSRATVNAGGTRFGIDQETSYPWNGSVRLQVHPERSARARFLVRLPGWTRGTILGAQLYTFADPGGEAPRLAVNGAPVGIHEENGYAVIDRVWEDGDSIELTLPLPIRRVRCDPRVAENRGKAALQRGPIVYCVEARDAMQPLDALVLGGTAQLSACWSPDLLGGVVALRGRDFTAVPYATWANRGPGPMRVWLRDE